jgi:hypothetical protein
MPNHCANSLRIHGKDKDINLMFKVVKGDELIDVNRIIPYPEKYKKMDELAKDWDKKYFSKENRDWSKRPKDGFNSGGYEWCIKNWGTKWGMYDFSEIKWFKNSAQLWFYSAWAPPLPVIIAMSKMFTKLTFTLRYFECGAEFKGVLIVKNGLIVLTEESDYHGKLGG